MTSIQIEIDVSGLAGFERAADALDEEANLAMSVAVDLVAEAARTTHDYVDRTGALTASIQPAGVEGSFTRGDLEGRVGFGASSRDGYAYGIGVELGTRPHEIRPRFRQALRFPAGPSGGAGWIFARKVNHPGTRPRLFMARALEASMPAIEAEFKAAIDDAMRRAGIGG